MVPHALPTLASSPGAEGDPGPEVPSQGALAWLPLPVPPTSITTGPLSRPCSTAPELLQGWIWPSGQCRAWPLPLLHLCPCHAWLHPGDRSCPLEPPGLGVKAALTVPPTLGMGKHWIVPGSYK